jgi:threonine/homoserine/homoserine lactone efflux protein
MPAPSTLALFAAACVVLLVVPGPAVLYIVTRSVAQGRSAGLVSMLGVHVGSIVHVAFAALGISALLYASATAFTVVRYAGAAYLILLGLQKLLARSGTGGDGFAGVAAASRRRLFAQGVVVNVLNPKTAIFFLAFLPQFVNPAIGPVAPQIAVLGGCFIALGIVSDGSYAMLASALAGRLRRTPGARRAIDRSSGAMLVGLGAYAAIAGGGGRQS